MAPKAIPLPRHPHPGTQTFDRTVVTSARESLASSRRALRETDDMVDRIKSGLLLKRSPPRLKAQSGPTPR